MGGAGDLGLGGLVGSFVLAEQLLNAAWIYGMLRT